jgi:hypothetical protein
MARVEPVGKVTGVGRAAAFGGAARVAKPLPTFPLAPAEHAPAPAAREAAGGAAAPDGAESPSSGTAETENTDLVPTAPHVVDKTA